MLEKFGSRGFRILAFPSNQFDLQEPAENHEILNGLKHVRPGGGWEPHPHLFIHAKIKVNGKDEHKLYTQVKKVCPNTIEELGERQYMYWDPVKQSDLVWNFEKFIIDRAGRPRYRFHPAAWGNNGSFVEPFIEEILNEETTSGSNRV